MDKIYKLASIKKILEENPEITDAEIGQIIGLSRSAVQRWRKKIEKERAAEHISNKVISTTTLEKIDSNGKRVKLLQWVKEDHKNDQWLEQIRSTIKDIADNYFNGYTPLHNQRTSISDTDILTVYPIPDLHLSLRTSPDEIGLETSPQIIEDVLIRSISELVQQSKPSHRCLIAMLGDFFHVDGIKPMTTRSGHLLDIGQSWGEMFRTGVYLLKTIIGLMLQKHEIVEIKSCRGNHDDISNFALMIVLSALYENSDRVKIDITENPFVYHEFGEVFIGLNHGNVSSEKLVMVMADDKSGIWGRTKYRYWLCGHIHHRMVKEFPGCTVEMFRALSYRDSWTHGRGFRGRRELNSICYHDKYGEIFRCIQPLDNI